MANIFTDNMKTLITLDMIDAKYLTDFCNFNANVTKTKSSSYFRYFDHEH